MLKDLETYADLIKNATNQEERNRIVSDAFGKSAQEMGRLFDDGSKGIAEWVQQAGSAGAVIDDATIQRARELNDAMTALRPELVAAQQEFAVLLAPSEIVLLGSFNEGLRETRDLATDIVNLDVTAEELALRAREDLIASVSHELRTPLTSITGYVDLALDDPSLSPVSRRRLARCRLIADWASPSRAAACETLASSSSAISERSSGSSRRRVRSSSEVRMGAIQAVVCRTQGVMP